MVLQSFMAVIVVHYTVIKRSLTQPPLTRATQCRMEMRHHSPNQRSHPTQRPHMQSKYISSTPRIQSKTTDILLHNRIVHSRAAMLKVAKPWDRALLFFATSENQTEVYTCFTMPDLAPLFWLAWKRLFGLQSVRVMQHRHVLIPCDSKITSKNDVCWRVLHI